MALSIIRHIAKRLGFVAVTALLMQPALANDQTTKLLGDAQMKVRDLYPLVTTPKLFEARDFYVKNFAFAVLFEASWFVYLSGPGDEGTRGATLAFMHPDHPSNPPGPEAFNGLGMILTVEVDDADEVFDRLKSTGAQVVHPLTNEEWGQRRFMVRDPAGILVDVVQQIEPKAGYWERYPVSGRQ
jgi:catechol 2,3-dioxygenase-like lactoylglutathione lyase family enzyme